ncbi:YdaU family protein [Thalassospira aquimaris]|uniref:YdaU family protein n=1 Tax=Thalassospira aquimaris TaxID=3037796 RepID=A0ABT6GHQ4_9PROT|nr:YdaU family protein [Thalassospira sp. FZY0004]MDG4721606.1 YdaU family protein [Thalassospira sp. FZY0004]
MSANDLPWFRFYPSDWLGGTRGMSATETGIYITLIANMYDRAEPLPEDFDRLARLCGTTKPALKKTLEILIEDGKIIKTDAGLWNSKVQKEIEFREEKSNRSASAAKQRWEKDQQNQDPDDASAMPEQSERNAKTMPRARVPEARSQKPEERDKSLSGDDDEIWILDEGSDWLLSKGLTETQIPRLIDDWLTAYPAKQVRDAIGQAQIAAANHPTSYIAKVLKNGPRSNLQQFPSDREKTRKEAEEAEKAEYRKRLAASRGEEVENAN